MLTANGFSESDVEIWVTETATHSGKPVEPAWAQDQSEEQQAAELVRRFVTSLGAGVSRISWARPYENYMYNRAFVDGYYDMTAIIYNGLGQEAARGIEPATKKLSWYAYQTLIAKVKGYESVIDPAPGVYECSFAGGRAPVFVVWDAGAGARPGDLLPGEYRGEVRVTDMRGNETLRPPADLLPGPLPVFIEPS